MSDTPIIPENNANAAYYDAPESTSNELLPTDLGDIFSDLAPEEAPAPAAPAATFEERYHSFIYGDVSRKALDLLESTEVDLNAADQRFSSAINLEQLRNLSVAVIGCGGLGNWQWRVLLGMGIKNVHVFDDDVVSIENIGPQAHSIMDLGLPKVEAVRRAALHYRGVSISAHNTRVNTLDDVRAVVGYTPDVIIGCTDSAEFRNGFIESLIHAVSNRSPEELPLLWLDYRMTLGDWVCYALPTRAMGQLRRGPYRFLSVVLDEAVNFYKGEAVFSPEEALQEPCTARAICYTGANVASYTGAILHWYLTDGAKLFSTHDGPQMRTEEEVMVSLRSYFLPWHESVHTYPKFLFRYSYSARDCATIFDSSKDLRFRAIIRNAQNSKNPLITFLNTEFILPFCAFRYSMPEEPIFTSDVKLFNLPGRIGIMATGLGNLQTVVYLRDHAGDVSCFRVHENELLLTPPRVFQSMLLEPNTDAPTIVSALFMHDLGTVFGFVDGTGRVSPYIRAMANIHGEVTINVYNDGRLSDSFSDREGFRTFLENYGNTNNTFFPGIDIVDGAIPRGWYLIDTLRKSFVPFTYQLPAAISGSAREPMPEAKSVTGTAQASPGLMAQAPSRTRIEHPNVGMLVHVNNDDLPDAVVITEITATTYKVADPNNHNDAIYIHNQTPLWSV